MSSLVIFYLGLARKDQGCSKLSDGQKYEGTLVTNNYYIMKL